MFTLKLQKPIRQLHGTFSLLNTRRYLFTSSAMSQKVNYEAIVIGSGQGGNPLAVSLAKDGRKTAVIEATHIGG
jgi:heterodisulfide reductase subunit A-like polyferredoxin